MQNLVQGGMTTIPNAVKPMYVRDASINAAHDLVNLVTKTEEDEYEYNQR